MSARGPLEYAEVSCSLAHCVGLTRDGRAFTWALAPHGNRFGQLCAQLPQLPPTAAPPEGQAIYVPREVHIGQRVVAVGAGGGRSAGHTALVAEDGALFTCGCDRWQQLGLSALKHSIGSNAAGYAWDGGKIWQGEPQRVAALSGVKIAKVALGQDHTLALDSDARTVYAWGKCSEGQLGVGDKAFLRPPCVSAALSSPAHGAVAVTALHAQGDCSAAVHEQVAPPSRTVVYVGKGCSELEQALRVAFNYATLK